MEIFTNAIRDALHLLIAGRQDVLEIFLLSMRVSGLAVVLGVLIGMPFGALTALYRFPARGLIITLIHTGFALPPVVVGLFVYMLLSRSGPAGHLDLLFTPPAMILAQSILAAPYVAGITLAAVQAVPPDVRLQARALGATRWQAVLAHVREARLGLVAAVVAGFGAVISEVGAVMMVGGNILGETRVMTTAIVLETRRGNFSTALALGLVLLCFAFAVNLVLTHLQQRDRAARLPW
ncbi:MAG TPA: ABC transporter permease [Longimicrobiales bacterium]|nr:ABC transporter permease [Longimicrobiales bacterium]